MQKPIIVVLNSISYSGTTWINTILSCHDRAFYLGPYHILLMQSPKEACKVHYDKCPFWIPFFESWDPENENFLVKLSEFAKKDYIIIQNPTEEIIKRDFDENMMTIKNINVIRDGRANVTSIIRHHPERFKCFYDAVNAGLKRWLSRKNILDSDQFFIKYEDFINSFDKTTQIIGDYLGLKYPQNMRYFWEFDMHMVAGNTGMLELYRRMNGLDGYNHLRSPFYNRAFEKIKANPDQPVVDESWKHILTRENLFIFDYLMGETQASFGYRRDVFSDDERDRYLKKYRLPFDPGEAPVELPRKIPEEEDLFRQFNVDANRKLPVFYGKGTSGGKRGIGKAEPSMLGRLVGFLKRF